MAKEITLEQLREKTMPAHIAIIMDGNGRWAKNKGMTRLVGHRIGVTALKKVVEAFDELAIAYLTVYAFSTENWKRPKEEVDGLMGLLVEFIDKELDYLHAKGVCINPIGQLTALADDVQNKILAAKTLTKDNKKLILNVALNYGGREEIVTGVKAVCRDVAAGKVHIDDLNEDDFAHYLYTKDQPDPDLVIRTSGELRISNFLLWQIAYSEFWITDVLWPDFTKQDLWQAIYAYQNRRRRFGAVEP